MKPNVEKPLNEDSAQKLRILKMELVLFALDLDKTTLAQVLEADRPSVSKALGQGTKYKRLQSRIADELCVRVKSLIVGEHPAA